MIDQNSSWCGKCGYHIAQEWIEAQECPFWECPLDKPRVVDTGDELHQVLGEALRAAAQQLPQVTDGTRQDD